MFVCLLFSDEADGDDDDDDDDEEYKSLVESMKSILEATGKNQETPDDPSSKL